MRQAIAAALACAAVLAGCNPQPQHAASGSPSPSAAPSGVPPLEIVGKGTAALPVDIAYQAHNRKVYEVLAASYVGHSAEHFEQAAFRQARVTFYDPDGSSLRADAPTAAIHNQQVTLLGGVHARTSTGLNLTCDRLTYDQTTALLHGEGHVRIDGMQGGQRELLTGNTFTSDVKLTRMVVR